MGSVRGLWLAALVAAVLSAFVGAESFSPAASESAVSQSSGLSELPELRTRASRTFAAADGKLVTRSWAGSVNFREGDDWRAIDNTLTVGSDGRARNRANRYGVELPATLADPVTVSRGSDWVSFGLVGGGGERHVSGAQAVYSGALDEADVRYTTLGDEVKEEIILRSPRAGSRFAFALSTSDGLTPEVARDGGVDFRDAAGERPLRVAPPVMWDANRVASTDLTFDLQRVDGQWRLELEADRTWLEAPDRAWPVTIDPTVTVSGQKDTYLNNAQPDSAYGPDTVISTGRSSSSGAVRRGLIQFDVSAIGKSKIVLSSRLVATTTSAHDASTITAHRVTRAWTTGASWNEYDSTNDWTTPGADHDTTAEDSKAVSSGSTDVTLEWHVGKLVQGWVDGTVANHGFLLKSTNETSASSVHLRSSTNASSQPYLEVVYQPRTGLKRDYTYDNFRLSDRMELMVNVATGDVILKQSDVQIAAAGLPININRYWMSSSPWDWSGRGWTFDMGSDVRRSTYDGGKTIVIFGPGMTPWKFHQNGSSWDSPPGVDAKLTTVSGGHELKFHRSGEKWFFGSNGTLEKKTDRNDNVLEFKDDAGDGNNTTDDVIHAGSSRELATTVNGQGRITSFVESEYGTATPPTGTRTWTYGYSSYSGDASGLMTSYTDPESRTTTYAYGSDHLIDTITDPRGNETRLTWDATTGRVTSVTRVTDTVTGAGPKTTYDYDSVNSKTTVTAPRGVATSSPTTDFQTIYTWDAARGQVTAVKNAKNQDATQSYTGNGDLDEHRDQTQAGATSAVNDPVWATSAYTGLGSSTDPSATNNLTSGTLPGSEGFSLSYHESSTDGLARYRPKKMTSTEGSAQWFSYDSAGNVSQIADAESGGGTPQVAFANLTYTDASDAPIPKGLLETATDGNNRTTTYEYWPNGDLKKVNPPLLVGTKRPGRIQFTYDGSGRIRTRTFETGAVLTYDYDKLDRVTQITTGSGATTTYTYDYNGNVTARTDSTSASSSYSYDKLNRRDSETIAGVTTSYSYDADSNLARLTDGWGTVAYGYDPVNRVESIGKEVSGVVTPEIGYSYNDTASPRTVEMTYPGGQKLKTETGLSGKPISIDYQSNVPASIRKLTYTYTTNPASSAPTFLRAQEEEHQTGVLNTTTRYGYDALDRLCIATTGTVVGALACGTSPTGGTTYKYAFDAASNRTSKNVNGTVTHYTYDAANQLCYSGTTSSASCPTPYTHPHDDNGNRTGGGGLTFGYDSYNRLSTVSGTTLTHLSPNNTELTAEGTTTYNNNILGLASSTSGGTTKFYLRSPSGAFLAERSGSTTRYVVPDALGSTRWLMDGNTVSRAYRYTPDGENASGYPMGAGSDAIIRFAGGHRLNTADVYHFGHRYYDAATARWTQRDPLDQPDDLRQANAYAYAAGDPINHADPSGTILPALVARTVIWRFGGKALVRWGVRKAEENIAGAHARVMTNKFAFGQISRAPETLPQNSLGIAWEFAKGAARSLLGL